MKNLLFIIVMAYLLMVSSLTLKAQDGVLDNTFGSGGVLTIPYGPLSNNYLKSVIVQPDGKILIGGQVNNGTVAPNSNFYINRINPDSTQDLAFNVTGGNAAQVFFSQSSLYTNSIEGMALQTDGTILFGGYAGSTQKAVVGKLNANGNTFSSPVAVYNTACPNNNVITGLSYNSNTNTIALSGYESYSTTYMLGLKFINNATSCPLDGSFNSGGTNPGTVYLNSTTFTLNNANAVINMDDGSVLLGGYSFDQNGYKVFTVVKLKKDGSMDNFFGVNGIAQVALGLAFTGYINAMKLLHNGEILLAGSANNSMGLALLNADGTIDNTFKRLTYSYFRGSTEVLNIAIQEDNKILVCGKCSNLKGGLILRCQSNGTIDSSFGTNGLLAIPNVITNNLALSVKDGHAYVVGQNGTDLMVAKIAYRTQPLNILGKDIASISSQGYYYVQPVKAGYTYQWSTTNTNVFTKNSATGDSLTVFFTNDTSSVTLICIISDAAGLPVKTLTKKIIINPVPTFAQLLTPPACAASQTNCRTSYINSFSILDTKVVSINTGCSPTGYFDLTSSSNYDTLHIGNSYQAAIRYGADTGTIAYLAVWIDFNNDGVINDAREFVGASSSTTGTIEINNILIPTDAEPGPKRVRARIRLSAPFTVNDFCPTNDETAETEDYLVVLNKYNGVKIPNFITPNNDGKNDLFIVHGVDGNAQNNLKVFNKIGDLVYEANEYDNTWGGKDQNGNSLKSGTYYYVFSQKVSDKKKEEVIKGFLEIRY